ncbi:MAG: Exonuclease SbcC [Myxococcaceae bacterium]|nr:Exonuclease SbcC [Myxococcaceae bacterium]
MAQEPDNTKKEARSPGPELRLIDRRAFVGFPELKLAPGVTVTDFALQIPDVTFPMNLSGGASKYQKKKLDFGFLELNIDAEVIHRQLAALAGKLGELDDLKLHFRPGYLEVQARLRSAERAALTFKAAFDGDGEKLAVYLYDVRFYAWASVPAARLPALVTQGLQESASAHLPHLERRGANGFTTRILPVLVELAAVARGFKMPSLDQARLAEASISGKGLRLRFSSGGLPPPSPPDEELLLTLEGARAFADAEELLAEGKLLEAREAYLKLGDATEAHPFAVERLLTLLVADPQAHEMALDVAASLHRRREKSATALWAEAVVRERRGEFARASERYLALCNLARRQQEEAGAFFAAEAGARAARDHAPQMAVKALHELLGLKPDHLPSLKALARASDQAKDRAGAIRAYRRLTALARDPADAAEAHVQLARLCAQTDDDIPGARLHCEAALRLLPDHPDALLQLGELCFKSGEYLRAIKALDRLREVGLSRHEVDRIGRANLLAGQVWELGLKQLENALLRYRESASLLPGEPEPLYLSARVADALGRTQEAVAGYQQAIELAGPAPAHEAARHAAHQSHHALAKLFKGKLSEPARAKDHLEAAFALVPTDLSALDELLPHFRATGRAVELADALEKAAAVVEDGLRRAALWAEAGELYRNRLAQPEKAERLLNQAVEADPRSRPALEGLLALAEARRDGPQLGRCLKALALLTEDPKDRVRHLRRLAVAARDLSFDLELAAWAFAEVLKVEPEDLPALGELCALQRRRADMAGLAWALERRAVAAETHGDKRLAAAALRELGQVLEARLGRPGEALVALEKAARLFPEVNALLDLANLSLRIERPTNARRALEDVLTLLPKHAAPEKLAEVRARLGKACDSLGDKDAARENYALAFPLRRLDDELCERLEVLYEEANLHRELTDLWAARAQALLQANRPSDAAPLFFKSAQALLNAGDRAGAQLRLAAVLDAAPTGEKAGEALEAMGDLELERGERLEAAKLYARRAGLEKEARAASRWFFKASTLAQGTTREETYLTQALERDGAFVPARLRHAELVFDADPATALKDLEVVLAADENDPDVGRTDKPALLRKAGFAAVRAQQAETARALLAQYAAWRPEDLEVSLELAKLHRRAGATEALVDLLGELWPRLEGQGRRTARREYAEGALQLGRHDEAREALRSALGDEPSDTWAAGELLKLLPVDDSTLDERSTLISSLITEATGDARAQLLSQRAELHRARGALDAARADLADASALADRPVPLLRALAEVARLSVDDAVELEAWRLALARAGGDEALVADAIERVLFIARARVERQELPKAGEAFELATTLPLSNDDRCDAFLGIAVCARITGDSRRAEAALLEASKQGPPPRRVEALIERAALLEARDARQDAISALEAALALAPRHPQSIIGLKRNLRAVRDWSGLAEVVAAEAAQTPRAQAAPLFTELAGLYLDQLGLPGPGEAALKRVVTLDPADVGARRRLAGLLAPRGEVEEATRLLEEAAASSGVDESATLLREAAALAHAAADDGRALRLYRKAHAQVPASGAQLQTLADLLYLHGAVREALPLQQQLTVQMDFADAPDEAERALLRLADLAEQTGDAALAEKTLRRVSQERPLNSVAIERLAALVQPRNPREALGLLAAHARALSPSPRTVERLLQLARRAREELADFELPAELYARAAEQAEAPLPIRLERAKLLRDAGRTGELMGELLQIAQLQLTSGEVEAALDTYQEEAELALQAGRVDEALKSLQAMAELCDEEGQGERAARLWVRRAELLRDSKLDLVGAEQSLQQAWVLDRKSETAELGIALARRRADRDAEIDWLERTLESFADHTGKARAFVALARLHLGLPAESSTGEALPPGAPMLAPDQAEAALKQALIFAPGLAEAEALLLAMYERQDRVGDVAAFFEESALRATSLPERARMLLRAAALYKEKANQPHAAAAALLAARAANPDDAALTGLVADQLHQLGRHQEAADFDALLLEADPFHPAFARHLTFLTESGDAQGRAVLLSRRAEKESGPEAASRWLGAAKAFTEVGANERARVCEDQAFEAAPEDDAAFLTLEEREKSEPRALADVLFARARAVPAQTGELLKRRAKLLTDAGEALEAAAAWDDLLAASPDDLDALAQRAELAASSGGPRASQPFDRRLLQLGGDGLAAELKLKLQHRLGHAALEAKAFHDAAEAFEAVRALDPDGPKGREALSLLVEAYTNTRDNAGLFRATLKLAELAEGAEATALYRRAADLAEKPQDAMAALGVLVRQSPSDEGFYARARQALVAMGKSGELLWLHEQFAEAAGGEQGAAALLEAADLVEREFQDEGRATDLRQKASRIDPSNTAALSRLAADQRRKGDQAGLLDTLTRLVPTLEEEPAAEALLELAGLRQSAGDIPGAREALQSLRARGAAFPGYLGALDALISLEQSQSNGDALGEVLLERAALESGDEKSSRLVAATRAFQQGGNFERALVASREALALRPSVEVLLLMVELARAMKQPRRAAQALVTAAGLSSKEPKVQRQLLIDAVAAWEQADEPEEAIDILERVVREHPDALSPTELAHRFLVLKLPARALAVGFAPLMAAGDFVGALKLADAAKDAAKATEALWALARLDGNSVHASRLADQLEADGDTEDLEQLALALQQSGAVERAQALWSELLLRFGSPLALQHLAEAGELNKVISAALEDPRPRLLELLLPHASAIDAATREALWKAAAEMLPARRKSLVRQLADLRKDAGRAEEAAFSLLELINLEENSLARSALHLERGELLLHELKQPQQAREEFERALVDDGTSFGAVRHLVTLTQGQDPGRFIAMIERLTELAGPEAVESYRPALVDAFEAQGRPRDALRLLGELPETPENLARRATLASALGLTGEALQLRERVTTSTGELEGILAGYLQADLIPMAVRLGERLVAEQKLEPATLRFLAERLSPTQQGAGLAVKVWPQLLERAGDADGWTLFAEALRQLGREDDAALADGFGAALTSGEAQAAAVRPEAVDAPDAYRFPPVPEGLMPVTDTNMPRLKAALDDALLGLGAKGVSVVLDPTGGPEAWLAATGTVVIGAGALAVYGQSELTYLLALALALGEAGHTLREPGEVKGFAEAAVRAFDAYPSSLSAGRVLTLLDPRVRGKDPQLGQMAQLLPDSPAFVAVARRALERLGR